MPNITTNHAVTYTNMCLSEKKFSDFYSPSKALSDDINLTMKLKVSLNPFWYDVRFCVKQNLNHKKCQALAQMTAVREKNR